MKNRPSFQLLLVAIITIILIAPFFDKAFHIDDPLFVWVAKQIQKDPLNPYGFRLTWYFDEMGMWEITKNPPLASYYIAIAACLVGWSEKALHLAFLIPTVFCMLGTYLLARRLCANPLAASLACLATPAFLVSATTLMSDVMMLSFWVWAILLWMKGLEKGEHLTLAASALLVAAAALTKYYGACLIPLLYIYTRAKRARVRASAAYLLVPIAVLAWYQWKTASLYGRGLFLDAGAYVSTFMKQYAFESLATYLTGLAFTGGGLAVILFYLPSLWQRRDLIIQTLSFAIATVFIYTILTRVYIPPFRDLPLVKLSFVIQYSLFVVIGINVLALAAADILRHKRDADSMLLFLWIIGTFAFSTFVNWTINVRSILPMAPAVGILLVRRMEARVAPSIRINFKHLFWPLLPAAALAVLVAWADYGFANSARSAAADICARYGSRPGKLRFEGHWGFQYYMEAGGAEIIQGRSLCLAPEDFLVIPQESTNTFPLRPDIVVRQVETLEANPSRWLTTMNFYMRANFFVSDFISLPFAIGHAPPEKYDILATADIDGGEGECDDVVAGYTRKLFDEYERHDFVARYPYYVNLLNDRANAYCAKGEYERAISDYTNALIAWPYEAGIYYNRAKAYLLKGDRGRASRDFKTARSLGFKKIGTATI